MTVPALVQYVTKAMHSEGVKSVFLPLSISRRIKVCVACAVSWAPRLCRTVGNSTAQCTKPHILQLEAKRLSEQPGLSPLQFGGTSVCAYCFLITAHPSVKLKVRGSHYAVAPDVLPPFQLSALQSHSNEATEFQDAPLASSWYMEAA